MATHQKHHSEQAKEAAQKQRTEKPAQQSLVALTEQAELATLQRAIADPRAARPADILALQRTVGNRAVTGLIQTKLMVGPAGDRYEQEADRVADQVLSMTIQASGRRSAVSGQPVQRQQVPEEEEEVQTKSLVQRALHEEEEEVMTKPLVQRQAEEEEEVQTKPLLQRQAEEEEEELQTKSDLQDGFEAGSDLEARLAAQKGSGSPLPDDVRAYMEPRFGADFSGVHVHADSEAAQLNRELSAQAFTHGQDIYLGAGKYDPGSSSGKWLLAHELTHVVQQTGGGQPQRPAQAQERTAVTTTVNFGSEKMQPRWGSARPYESSNLFASMGGRDPVPSRTLAGSMARATPVLSRSPELTIQRLYGTLTAPNGNIAADWNGTKISKQFDMDANFFPKAEQQFGEYRQYIKGGFSTPTGDLKHDLGGVYLDLNTWHEDGPGQYGHRGNPNQDVGIGKDWYDNLDRPTGNHYSGRDTPSLTPGGAGQYTMDLYFKGELIDTRNSTAFATKNWHISRTVNKT